MLWPARVSSRSRLSRSICSSRIKAAVGARALRLHRAVALFPNPNDVRAQPGAAGDRFDGMMGFSHKSKTKYRHN